MLIIVNVVHNGIHFFNRSC